MAYEITANLLSASETAEITPTPELRFVDKRLPNQSTDSRVLQQKWATITRRGAEASYSVEWRDVPFVADPI